MRCKLMNTPILCVASSTVSQKVFVDCAPPMCAAVGGGGAAAHACAAAAALTPRVAWVVAGDFNEDARGHRVVAGLSAGGWEDLCPAEADG